MNTKERRKSTRSTCPHPQLSFSSLPYDLVLNCLARVPRIYHPTLSLVFKTFQSIISSHELDSTRTRIEKTEHCHIVCLRLNKKKPDPSWFVLSKIPNQQKLIPVPPFPFPKNPTAPTVLLVGSEIYVIGGFLNRAKSKRVFVLDCRTHQWRRLPDMHVPRRHPAADAEIIEGKTCVIGGNYDAGPHWIEVYDPKTQTWEPLPKSVFPHFMIMDGKVYSHNGMKVYNGKLGFEGTRVKGLEELSTKHLCAVSKSGEEE